LRPLPITNESAGPRRKFSWLLVFCADRDLIMPKTVEVVLSAADRQLALEERLTLDPKRARASSLQSLWERSVKRDDSAELKRELAESLPPIALSIAEHFPENIFWDLDFLAASLIGQARSEAAKNGEGAGVQRMRDTTELLVDVQARYGVHSAIRFRYVHDFIYGYDWARWVAREPQTRTAIGPYDLVFVQRMRDRSEELLELIGANDDTYPPLEHNLARNPFGFSREPAAESALLFQLARAELIPVEAWRTDPAPNWNRPYGELREQQARKLGLMSASR
jgi:hypothetical protein